MAGFLLNLGELAYRKEERITVTVLLWKNRLRAISLAVVSGESSSIFSTNRCGPVTPVDCFIRFDCDWRR